MTYLTLLAVGTLISLGIMIATLIRYGLSAIAVRPIFVFTFFFAVIHFVTPAMKAVEGVYRYQLEYDADVKLMAVTLNIFLLLFAWILSCSKQFSPLPRASHLPNVTSMSSAIHIATAIIFFLVGVAIALLDAYTIYFEIGYNDFVRDMHAFSDQRSALRIFSNLMILGSSLYLAAIVSREKTTPLMLSVPAAMVSVIVIYAFFLNSRNTVFLTLIIHVIVYFGFSRSLSLSRLRVTKFVVNRSTIKQVCLLAAVIGVALLAMGKLTEYRYGSFDSDYSTERRERVVFYALDGAFGNDENMLWLLQSQSIDYQFGRTYLAAFLNVIPRKIWVDKPVGAGPILINMIRPGSYVPGQEGNNSLTTGLVTEAFMNFGYFGVFVSIVFWAYLASRAMRAFQATRSVYCRTAFLVASLMFSSAMLYQEFLGFVARVLVMVVPLLFVGALLRGGAYSGCNRATP